MRIKILTGTYLLIIISDSPVLRGIVPQVPGLRHILLLLGCISALILTRKNRIRLLSRQKIILFLLGVVAIVLYPTAAYHNWKYVLGLVFSYLFYGVYIITSQINLGQVRFEKLLATIANTCSIFAIYPLIVGIVTGESLRGIPGVFRESGALAFSSVIGFALSFELYLRTKKSRHLMGGVVCFAAVVFSTLKKSYIEIALVTILMLKGKARSNPRAYLAVSVLALISLGVLPKISLLLGENIQQNMSYYETVGAEGHVRIGMYTRSIAVAMDKFPFGSGFGSFASLASIIGEYSLVHLDYGVDLLGSNAPADVSAGAHTLLDTFWPHVIAEMGFVGAIIILGAYLSPILDLNGKYRNLFCAVISAVLIDGLFLYTPEIPFAIFLVFALCGLAVAVERNAAKKHVLLPLTRENS